MYVNRYYNKSFLLGFIPDRYFDIKFFSEFLFDCCGEKKSDRISKE